MRDLSRVASLAQHVCQFALMCPTDEKGNRFEFGRGLAILQAVLIQASSDCSVDGVYWM